MKKDNKTKHLYEEIAFTLEELIKNGAFKAGEKVPSIREMSRQKNVSLNTVKLAYNLLEDRNIIKPKQNSGYYVAPKLSAMPEMPVLNIKRPVDIGISKGELVIKILQDIMSPDKIKFGAAIPDPELIPSKKLAAIMGSEAKRLFRKSAEYEITPGLKSLRIEIAKRLIQSGLVVSPDEIIITNGASEAVHLALRATCKEGDAIAIGSPIYFNFIKMIQELKLKVVEIPSCPETGLLVSALKGAVLENDIKACLVISNFNNPLGISIPDETKKEIVSFLAERKIPLIEDDINGDLGFSEKRPLVCKAFDEGGEVLLCSSFSKTIAPGYRTGWIVPGRYHSRVQDLKLTINMACPTPTQMAVAEFLKNGGYDRHLKHIRKVYAAKVARMTDAICRYFPYGTKITRPEGGFMLWIKLPHGMDSMELYLKCNEKGISIAPGSIFSSTLKYSDCIRLNAAIWEDFHLETIKTMGSIIEEILKEKLK